ncbi:hypothetical protein C0W54_14305 [Photobacterium kishitanii]|uniref:lipopolysaccharide biosynthesis protein n=1 Tax=Photobacterium kishitanii TaxID=318456 RepID=UPI000D156A6E|nr:lipopolysaccharide biosynthesis protein [Photobacterium kishitanii]PSW60646.1 hypothetical protein C0W54_14305 [Photobacterium kishitanii]
MGNNDRRSKILKKNIYIGTFSKLISIIVSFALIKEYINLLGTDVYGLWVTLFSIVSWVNIADVGIGNGLKVKLSEYLAKNNYTKAREYIITSYVVIGIISGVIFVVFFILNNYFLVSNFFNVKNSLANEVNKSFLFLMISLLAGLAINLYKPLLISIHKSSYINIIYAAQQLLILIVVLSIKGISTISIVDIALINSIIPIVTGCLVTFLFFKNIPSLVPFINDYSINKVKDITSFGGKFFLIQISAIIIFTTDNTIIAKMISSDAVTSYDLVFKLFQNIIVIWYLVSSPLMALFSEAFYKNDFFWIIGTIKKLNFVFLFLIIGVFLLIPLSPYIIKVWIGYNINIPVMLPLYFGLFVLLRIYSDLYLTFLNAVGKLNIQLIISIIGAVINIPLSIFFIKYLDMGSHGVILATCISIFPLVIITPIQTYLFLKYNKSNRE